MISVSQKIQVLKFTSSLFSGVEKGMATHSSILAWRIPMDRGAWWVKVRGVVKSQTLLSD